MTDKKDLKIAGLVLSGVGMAISFIASTIYDKRQELEIQEAVDKAIADRLEDKES